MKTLNLKSLVLVGILVVFSSAAIYAQQNMQQRPPKDGFRPQQILRELGLSKEQVQQIRRLNQEREPVMREAQERLRDANRNLDQAIYAENLNETEIQTRLKEVQLAQAEVIKLRNMTELAVRKILTPEQLTKFRQLREEIMRRMEQQRMEERDIPPQERDETDKPPVNDRPFQQRQKKRGNF